MNEEVNEDDSLHIDVYGLTREDWASLSNDGDLSDVSGPALLWWALVGGPDSTKEEKMSGFHMQDLFTSVVNEARALARLASSSSKADIREIAPLINNLYRYITVVAEIANRQAQEDEMRDVDRRLADASR